MTEAGEGLSARAEWRKIVERAAHTEAGEGIEPAFGLIGGPECPVCLGKGFRCHPDGGLIACAEGCERCDAVVEDRARALGPIKWTEEGVRRIAADLGLDTEAGEGLSEAERETLGDAVEHGMDANCWQGECPDALWTVVEQILRDRQADTLEAAAEAWPGLSQAGGNVYVWLRDRARTLRGER